MKIIYIVLVMCLTMFKISAQKLAYSGNADASFLNAREIAFTGNRAEARDTLRLILSKYPNYTDVRTLLAKTYSWDGAYDEARLQFNKITSSDKNNKDVWVAAIKNEIYGKNYSTAIGLSNKALLYLKEDITIIGLKEEAIQAIEKLQRIALSVPELDSTKASVLEPKNSIDISGSIDVFNKVYDPMYLTSISYTLKTKYGSIIPRINYANRFNTSGIQYEVDAYPQFSKKAYMYANYGFSEAGIFPKHRAGAELYVNLPKAMEVSLGARYLNFITSDVYIYTASFGLYSGNYFFSLRPYITPSEGNSFSVSGNILARKYLKDNYNYWGANFSYGYTSDIKQFKSGTTLLAETLLYLETQQLNLEYQFTFRNNPNTLKTMAGVTRQELSFDPGSFFIAGTVGFIYQVKF
ncbi:YaiO family outer membrane beta-barrel protein [Cellulophaga sp. E16_2]|uniref:YaiO beta-barrel domain-containing protein n=2 Tax=Cellulophaga TaxID=104264 RepID=E6XEN9_CELAD|nr:YaiO family outer membrane beta-barrel protein [Cellulophaga sp. E16_2]ADV51367.1 hypothetical protein Celal_4125 [Cellulophaga algicola DSM 14237]